MVKRENKFGRLIEQQATEQTDYTSIFPEKVSLDKIRKIWDDDQVQYTDEQLYKIREWVYAMAGVILDIAEQQRIKDNKIIELKPIGNEEQESNFICPGEYRRAS